MKLPAAGLAAIATICSASPASATSYPWCGYSGEVGTPICAYTTFDQCRMSARSCIENGHNATKTRSKKAKGSPRAA